MCKLELAVQVSNSSPLIEGCEIVDVLDAMSSAVGKRL